MPDLQTALKTALSAAGEKTPTKMSRIWNFIKDSGGSKTSKQVVSTLKIPAGTATSLLAQMVKRQMLAVCYETSHKNSGRNIAHYSAPAGMRIYTLMPAPKKEQAEPKLELNKSAAVVPKLGPATITASVLTQNTAVKPVNLDDIESFVSSLTLPKGRDLYRELCKYFGDQS